MLWFLNEWYFPRIKWAKLTLKPCKSAFFVSKIDPLGMTINSQRLRASKRKQDKMSQYPTPTSEKEIDDFLYLTIYLKALILGRTEHVRILKEAVIREEERKVVVEVVTQGGKGIVIQGRRDGKKSVTQGRNKTEEEKKEDVIGEEEKEDVIQEEKKTQITSAISARKGKKGKAIGFRWGVAQQISFNHIKRSILDNMTVGGNPARQYYLSVCASRHGLGSVLFQLEEEECKWGSGLLKSHLCFLTSKKHKQDYKQRGTTTWG